MSLLVLWSLRSVVVTLIGGLVTLCLRRRSAAVRSLSLRATLLAAWLLPFAALVAPRIEVALPRPAAPLVQVAPVLTTSVEPPMPTQEVNSVPPVEAPATLPAQTIATPRPAPVRPLDFVSLVYAFGVLALSIRWLASLVRLRRIATSGEAVAPGLIRVAEIGVPATFGLIRPAILLPVTSVDWPEDRVRAAVLHEEAHIRRRDWLWQMLANLFATLHWFNPAAWLLARSLRDTAEKATDDEVLADGFAATVYARELLSVAAMASKETGVALTMARRGGVTDRIAAILHPGRDRRRPTRRASVVVMVFLLGIGIVVAGVVENRNPQASHRFTADLKDGGKLTNTVELIGLGYPGGQGWRPDGTPDASLKPPATKAAVETGWRRISIGFRIQGELTEPRIRATIWGKSACPSDGFIVQNVAGDPNGHIVWCTVRIRPGITASRIGVDLYAGPWITHVDGLAGKSDNIEVTEKGSARPSNRELSLFEISFPNIALPSPDRFAELSVTGTNSRATTYLGASPFGSSKKYQVMLNRGEKVRQVSLRSRAVDHARFEAVHLEPSVSQAFRAVLADGRIAEVVRIDRLQGGQLKQRALAKEPIELSTLQNLNGFPGLTQGLGTYLQISGKRRGAPTLSFRISYPSGFTGIRSIGYPKGYEIWNVMFDPPASNIREATLGIGVAFGNWTVINRNAPFKTRKVKTGGVCLDVFQPEGMGRNQIRLLARDQNGRLIAGWQEVSTLVKDGETTLVAYSKDQTLRKVASVEVQSRMIHWTALPKIPISM